MDGSLRRTISTLAPREGSDFFLVSNHLLGNISTLAPREGSDAASEEELRALEISTLAPREGSDVLAETEVSSYAGFQPSLPARGATAKTTKNYFGIFAKQRKNNLTFNKISDFLLFHSF